MHTSLAVKDKSLPGILKKLAVKQDTTINALVEKCIREGTGRAPGTDNDDYSKVSREDTM